MRAQSPENVSDLIAKPAEQYDPEPRYVSKYLKKILRAEKRSKSAHKTLGVANIDLDSPLEYLKKGTGIIPKRPNIHHKHYRRPDYQRKLPDWEPIKASEIGKEITGSGIDFTKRNFKEAINLRPMKARMYYVDDRHGNAHSLKTSGMYPRYVKRKDYGQVPSYIESLLDDGGDKGKKKAAGHPKGKGRSRQRATSPRKEEKSRPGKKPTSPPRGQYKSKLSPKQKIASPKGEEQSKESPRQEISSPRREEKLRGGSQQNSISPRADDKSKKSLVQNSISPRADEKSKKSLVQKSISAQTEDKSKGEENGGKENFEKGEKTETERKSQSGSKSEKRRSSKSVDFDDNVDKQSIKTIGDYKQPRCRYVTEDERDELLYGMKKKWDEMMKQFQCLPILTDSQPKAKRKSGMEKDLLQLEKDIEIIESHPYIYVYSDDEEN